ncbi:hypothetical protein L596_017055 [Steinernema carpocapsae]|uniref:Uncharacterized protein n=1 Tax=Steinernema carpocapsae TaxID=34508 RepID=A0A4U5N0C3_STECR|nr:hypothetical protein L596_017055 [Steinernema carpocapsae]
MIQCLKSSHQKREFMTTFQKHQKRRKLLLTCLHSCYKANDANGVTADRHVVQKDELFANKRRRPRALFAKRQRKSTIGKNVVSDSSVLSGHGALCKHLR